MQRLSTAADARPLARHLTRGLAVAIVLAAGAGWAALRYFTDPVTVRRVVLDQLRKQFPGAEGGASARSAPCGRRCSRSGRGWLSSRAAASRRATGGWRSRAPGNAPAVKWTRRSI